MTSSDGARQIVTASLAIVANGAGRGDVDMLAADASDDELREAFSLLACATGDVLIMHSGADRVLAHMRREAARSAEQ